MKRLPIKSLFFFPHRFFSSPNYILKTLKLEPKPSSLSLLSYIISYPTLAKNQEFKIYLKNQIIGKLDSRMAFSKIDLFLIRILLTYSKFSGSSYDWRGTIYKSIETFKEKELNIYDLALIMSIYYDAMRRYYEIKGKENDFFNDKNMLFLKEKEYNIALSLTLKNLKDFFKVWRGKAIEGKLFYELVTDRFFQIVDTQGYHEVNNYDILYFAKVFIGFEFKHEKFEEFFYKILKDQTTPLNELKEIYLIYFKKHYFAFPDIFKEFLSRIERNLLSTPNLEISKISDPHMLHLPSNYINTLLGSSFKITETSENLLTNKTLLDLYWMLSKNYDPNNENFLNILEKTLQTFIDKYCLKELILLLISKIYHNLNQKHFVFSDYEILLESISNKISKEANAWEIMNLKTIGGSLHLALKYLNSIGYSEMVSEKFNEEIMLFLARNWISWTRNQKYSTSEKIIRKNIEQVLKKFDKKSLRFGALVGETYYCDIIIEEKYIIEVNGDQHYNLFYRNKIISDEKFRFIGNFLLKKEILWNKGYIVSDINEDDYRKFLHENEKLQKFLYTYLKNLFEQTS